jgi:prolipoprotein diacylglyceryltransferase
MRRLSAVFGIVAALIGTTQLLMGRGNIFALTTAAYTVALLWSSISALRGGRLIYLATSWGVYLGMTLAAYFDVENSFLGQQGPIAQFGAIVVALLIITELIGLGLALLAYQKEYKS